MPPLERKGVPPAPAPAVPAGERKLPEGLPPGLPGGCGAGGTLLGEDMGTCQERAANPKLRQALSSWLVRRFLYGRQCSPYTTEQLLFSERAPNSFMFHSPSLCSARVNRHPHNLVFRGFGPAGEKGAA